MILMNYTSIKKKKKTHGHQIEKKKNNMYIFSYTIGM